MAQRTELHGGTLVMRAFEKTTLEMWASLLDMPVSEQAYPAAEAQAMRAIGRARG